MDADVAAPLAKARAAKARTARATRAICSSRLLPLPPLPPLPLLPLLPSLSSPPLPRPPLRAPATQLLPLEEVRALEAEQDRKQVLSWPLSDPSSRHPHRVREASRSLLSGLQLLEPAFYYSS
jgi:hypothetical protein